MTDHSMAQTLDDAGRLSTAMAQAVHDPLKAIKASLHLLQGEDVPPAVVHTWASDIGRQVERLDRIVGDFVDFARPLQVELAPVEVAALVWDAAGAVLDGWEGPHLRVALEPGTGTIVTDGERLRGVLASLLENARQAVRAAGRTGAVGGMEIGGRRVAPCRLLLWVEDRGPGLSAAELPRVFEPLFTARHEGGTGLGVVRKVVDALGGTVRVESREGEGTRVEVELPDDARLRGSAEPRRSPRRWGSLERQEERR